MKLLFVICAVILSGLTILAVETLPERRSNAPLLWWTSDANPARGPQIKAFEEWMVKKGYGPVDMELDSATLDSMKVIIQSVSKVGSDVIDVYGAHRLHEYVVAGVLLDVTDLAKEYGFGPDKTYASVWDSISVDGRQYTFPCNVGGSTIIVNRALLERENLPLPKYDWTWDEFLQWCLKVRKVDSNGRVTRYAMMPFGASYLWFNNGGSIFNETMTRCVLDSPQVLEATRFYYDLMFKHKVIPTATTVKSRSAAAGYGGGNPQWIGNEWAVGMAIGRFGLIRLREFKNFKPDVALLPYKVIPVSIVGARSAGINAYGKNPRLAARFLQYLADKEYNQIIVKDADGLPPSPSATTTPAFLTPAEYPNEHGAHEKFSRAVKEYGAGWECSPFINSNTVMRILRRRTQGLDSQSRPMEQTLRIMTDEINREMRLAVGRDDKLKPRYQKACELQKKIDQLKKEGKPVPMEWISDPMLRYFRRAGK